MTKNRKPQKPTDCLTPKQARVLRCMLSAPSVSAGMRSAGVNRGTWYEYMKQESFRTAYHQQVDAMLDTVTDDLTLLMSQSNDVLRKLLTSRNEQIRLQASKTIHDLALRHRELSVESRLFSLEQERGER